MTRCMIQQYKHEDVESLLKQKADTLLRDLLVIQTLGAAWPGQLCTFNQFCLYDWFHQAKRLSSRHRNNLNYPCQSWQCGNMCVFISTTHISGCITADEIMKIAIERWGVSVRSLQLFLWWHVSDNEVSPTWCWFLEALCANLGFASVLSPRSHINMPQISFYKYDLEGNEIAVWFKLIGDIVKWRKSYICVQQGLEETVGVQSADPGSNPACGLSNKRTLVNLNEVNTSNQVSSYFLRI